MFGLFDHKYTWREGEDDDGTGYTQKETSQAERSIKTRSKYSGHTSTTNESNSDRVRQTRERREGKRF